MQKKILSGMLGRFIQIYSVLMLIPVILTFIYPENPINFYLFAGASSTGLIIGSLMKKYGSLGDPTIREAMILTLAGWISAIVLGAIPLMYYIPVLDAIFEAASGLTTTGISLINQPGSLPHSVIFWRSFMQWVGGLGILTFFVAVIKKSGSVSRKLFSAEAHKTDPGSIRPSLKKSVKDLWLVYTFLTAGLISLLVMFQMPIYEAFVHAFSALSTGGFSTNAASFAAYTPEIKSVVTLSMFIGGINFVIIYRFLKTDYRPLGNNLEFKTYFGAFMALSLILYSDLIGKVSMPLLEGLFQSASFISSTGFSTLNPMIFSSIVQLLLMIIMFMGGSLGSTAGGIKVFRVLTMFKLLLTRIRSYSLPESALNSVKIDGEVLENSTVKTISVLFFIWVVFTFVLSMLFVAVEGYSFKGSLSLALSAIGNMGPIFLDTSLANASIFSKLSIILAMIAGRLEMIPLLAVFNKRVLKN